MRYDHDEELDFGSRAAWCRLVGLECDTGCVERWNCSSVYLPVAGDGVGAY